MTQISEKNRDFTGKEADSELRDKLCRARFLVAGNQKPDFVQLIIHSIAYAFDIGCCHIHYSIKMVFVLIVHASHIMLYLPMVITAEAVC